MRLQDVGSAIVKRLWIIIALVLISTLVGGLIAYIQNPVYKVEIVVVATPPKNPTTKLPDATIAGAYSVGGILPSIANACESFDVATKVSERLIASDINIPPEELLDKVSAIPEMQSTSIRIAITDGSPTRAAEIANAWGDVLTLKTLPIEANELYDPTFGTLLLGGTIAFTNRAVPPKKPTQPKPLLYVGLGALIGLILGLTLVIGIEYFDPHFRSTQETEEILGLPILGIVPKERGAKANALLPTLEEGSLAWNAYSDMRSMLIFSQKDEDVRSILVAPAIPFVAGPTVAANLAVSIANSGRKTLLIDGDMSEQSVSSLLGASEKPGLSDALEQEQSLYGKVIKSGVGDLDLLPAGKTSPKSTDLISLPFFEEGLHELEDLYDLVVIYAPPLIMSMNGAVIASKTHVSLVLIDADLCTRRMALEALITFERLNIKPSGVVLVNVKIRGGEHARVATKAKPAPVATMKEGKRKEAAAVAVARPSLTKSATTPVEPVIEEETKPAAERSALLTSARTAPPPSPAVKTVPEPTVDSKVSEEAEQVNEVVVDDFRRLGEKGAPIPKTWLRALNSDKPDVRDSAESAITTYYNSFLRRYSISEESVINITDSILKMMRREGDFARMSEEEAQQHLRKMLVDAGARFATTSPKNSVPAADVEKPSETQLKVQEKKRFPLEERGGKKRARLGKGKASQPRPENEEGTDWE